MLPTFCRFFSAEWSYLSRLHFKCLLWRKASHTCVCHLLGLSFRGFSFVLCPLGGWHAKGMSSELLGHGRPDVTAARRNTRMHLMSVLPSTPKKKPQGFIVSQNPSGVRDTTANSHLPTRCLKISQKIRMHYSFLLLTHPFQCFLPLPKYSLKAYAQPLSALLVGFCQQGKSGTGSLTYWSLRLAFLAGMGATNGTEYIKG